jgi:3-oxoacyl-[acyl-carrier protein] reductase
MIDFDGKVLFLTGAAGGIGRAIAETFLRGGARLVLADRRGTDLEGIARGLGAPERVATAFVDVTVPAEIDTALLLAKERFGGLDYVVPNAGIFRRAPMTEMTEAEWQATLAVNLDGVFSTVRAALPLIRDGGAVVTIASVAGHRGAPGYAHYAASKGAVLTFTRSLAVEIAPRLRANAVSPGVIDTPMVTGGLIEERKKALLSATPLGRMGRPEEVANVVAFLCSDLASYMTGATVHVNGGLYLAS